MYRPGGTSFHTEWERICVDGAALSESSRKPDKQILANHLRPYFGKVHVRGIDVRSVDAFKAHLRAKEHQFGVGLSAKTINNVLSVLHRVMEKAIEYGHIERNPVNAKAWFAPETTPEESRPWWTPAEEARAFAVLGTRRDKRPLFHIMISVQLVTGIRFSELRALRKDLDLQAPGLWIRRAQPRKEVTTPKNKRARFQPIPRPLADELRRWMLRSEGQLLFPGMKGGPLPNNTLNKGPNQARRGGWHTAHHEPRPAPHGRHQLRRHGRRQPQHREPPRPRGYEVLRALHPRSHERARCAGGGAVGADE